MKLNEKQALKLLMIATDSIKIGNHAVFALSLDQRRQLVEEVYKQTNTELKDLDEEGL